MSGNAKRRAWAIVGGLLLLSAVLFAAHIIVAPRQRADVGIDAADVAQHLKDGDVICRMGGRFWSAFIGKLSPDDRRFSHLGIVKLTGDSVTVINAECLTQGRSESVNETPLPEFLALAKAVGVYRANFIDGSTLSNKAVEYLGRPFDWDFDLSDESKIYCTELLYAIIKHAAPEHSLKAVQTRGHNRPIVVLEAVSNSSDFDEVLYISNMQE
jgi:hypothetical protein